MDDNTAQQSINSLGVPLDDNNSTGINQLVPSNNEQIGSLLSPTPTADTGVTSVLPVDLPLEDSTQVQEQTTDANEPTPSAFDILDHSTAPTPTQIQNQFDATQTNTISLDLDKPSDLDLNRPLTQDFTQTYDSYVSQTQVAQEPITEPSAEPTTEPAITTPSYAQPYNDEPITEPTIVLPDTEPTETPTMENKPTLVDVPATETPTADLIEAMIETDTTGDSAMPEPATITDPKPISDILPEETNAAVMTESPVLANETPTQQDESAIPETLIPEPMTPTDEIPLQNISTEEVLLPLENIEDTTTTETTPKAFLPELANNAIEEEETPLQENPVIEATTPSSEMAINNEPQTTEPIANTLTPDALIPESANQGKIISENTIPDVITPIVDTPTMPVQEALTPEMTIPMASLPETALPELAKPIEMAPNALPTEIQLPTAPNMTMAQSPASTIPPLTTMSAELEPLQIVEEEHKYNTQKIVTMVVVILTVLGIGIVALTGYNYINTSGLKDRILNKDQQTSDQQGLDIPQAGSTNQADTGPAPQNIQWPNGKPATVPTNTTPATNPITGPGNLPVVISKISPANVNLQSLEVFDISLKGLLTSFYPKEETSSKVSLGKWNKTGDLFNFMYQKTLASGEQVASINIFDKKSGQFKELLNSQKDSEFKLLVEDVTFAYDGRWQGSSQIALNTTKSDSSKLNAISITGELTTIDSNLAAKTKNTNLDAWVLAGGSSITATNNTSGEKITICEQGCLDFEAPATITTQGTPINDSQR